MGKKFKILVVAASVAAVLVLSVGTMAMAAGPRNGAGNGVCLGGGEAGCDQAVCQLLGMTAEEIQALRQQGQSLVQIAAAKGISQEKLVAAIMAAKTAEVQARVKAGTLTQEQATIMLQQMAQNTVRAVTRTTVGRPEWAGTGQCGADCSGGAQAENGASNGQPGLGTGPGKMHKWGRS